MRLTGISSQCTRGWCCARRLGRSDMNFTDLPLKIWTAHSWVPMYVSQNQLPMNFQVAFNTELVVVLFLKITQCVSCRTKMSAYSLQNQKELTLCSSSLRASSLVLGFARVSWRSRKKTFLFFFFFFFHEPFGSQMFQNGRQLAWGFARVSWRRSLKYF